nr:hypothetical protein [Tanacetum cinerariifolium]
KTVRPEPPMSASMEAFIARQTALLLPPLPIPYLPLPLTSPLTTSLTDTGAPLGYRAAGIRMRALLSSTSRRTDVGYGITDTWDEIVDKIMKIAPTTLEGVNERVTELDSTVRQRTDVFEEFSHGSPCQDFKDTGCCTDYPDYITTDPVDYGTWTYRGIKC